MKTNKKTIWKRVLLSLLISVLLPLSIFISIPFEIFASNYEEFVFTLADFFPVCVGFFFLTFVVLFLAIFFLPKKAYRIVSAIIIALSLMFFIQGSFLNAGLSTLNGDYVGSGNLSLTTEIINIVIWAIVIAVAVALAILKDKKKILSYAGLVLAFAVLSTQIISPVSSAISNAEVFMSSEERMDLLKEDGTHNILTNENLNTVSKTSNIFYFVVDRFDERFAESAQKIDETIYDELTGFTWFQDHLSVYSRTYPSVANMLTNYTFDPNFSRTKYLNDAYENEETLSILNENGYSVNLYTSSYYSFTDAYKLPSYVANRAETKVYEVNDKLGLSFSLIELALYRSVPFFIKDLLWIDSSTSNNYIMETDQNGYEKYSTELENTEDFINSQELSISENEKGFYFIHTTGCHSAEDFTTGGELAIKNLKLINQYLQFLKQNNLYKDATIIITGDHGFVHDNNRELDDYTATALFVKLSGRENEKMETSQAQTSHKNMWATIYKSAGITTSKDFGKSVFEIPEQEPQEREFYWYTWGHRLVAYEYKVVGSVKDFSNWEIVDVEYFDKTLSS